jgi:hypothetical protein
MNKKMTAKQLAAWLASLPDTTPVCQLACSVDLTVQQTTALLAKQDSERQAVRQLHADLYNLDRVLLANAESDAGENMRPELNDSGMLGYWAHFHNHLISAAQVHWESAGRDLNAEIGRNVC